MAQPNNQQTKLLLYVVGGLTVASSILIWSTAESNSIHPAWAVLPAAIGTAIILLNRFKKIN